MAVAGWLPTVLAAVAQERHHVRIGLYFILPAQAGSRPCNSLTSAMTSGIRPGTMARHPRAAILAVGKLSSQQTSQKYSCGPGLGRVMGLWWRPWQPG